MRNRRRASTNGSCVRWEKYVNYRVPRGSGSALAQLYPKSDTKKEGLRSLAASSTNTRRMKSKLMRRKATLSGAANTHLHCD